MQCDWVGGENLVQFLSVRIHPLFLSIYSPGGMNDFHITTRRTAFAHTLAYEVFCGRVLERSEMMFEGQVISFLDMYSH